MKAKNLISILFLSLIVVNIQAQIRNIGDNQTAELILNSNKDYKLIYIFCNYCQASQARLPNVADFVKNRNDIEAFYICAQADFEVAEYMDTCKAKTTMYLINQQRKRKLIDFYNPIKATCKFIKKHFGVKTDNAALIKRKSR